MHCDGENDDRGMLCGMACGGAANPARQKIYASYATAFFLARLSNDAAAAAVIANANLANDTGVTSLIRTTSSCAAPDGRALRQADISSSNGLALDGPESSGTGSGNASSGATPGAADPATVSPVDEQGGSCRAAGPTSGTSTAGVLAVVALLLLGARRRS